MRTTLALNFLLLTFQILGQNIEQAGLGEKDKKGFYVFKTDRLPSKYHDIWKLSKFANFYKRQVKNHLYADFKKLDLKWSIFVPRKYASDGKTGLIILASKIKIDLFPEAWKQVSENLNYILIAPDLTKNHDASLELTYAAMNIISSRYKIDQSDINYIALSKAFFHNLHIHSQDKISGILNINSQLTPPKNVPTTLLNDNQQYFSFTIFERKTPKFNISYKVIVENNISQFELENVYSFDRHKFELKVDSPIKKTIKLANGTEVLQIDQHDTIMHETIFKNVTAEELIQLLNFRDNKQLLFQKVLNDKAINFETKNNLAQAMETYKVLHIKFQSAEAQKKFQGLEHLLNQNIEKVKNLYESKEFLEAYELAKDTVAKYGLKHTQEVLLIIKTCETNKNIQKEFKAASYLKKIELAISNKKTPKLKIISALKEVISYSPNTKTAEKAQEILKGLN